MRSSTIAAILLATLVAGPQIPAQVAKEGEGYRLKVKYLPGQKTKFSVVTDVIVTGGPQGMPAPPKNESTVEQEVVSVEKGIATLKVTTTGAPTEVPEQTIQVDERGQIVGKDKASMTGYPSGLPDRPLKEGEEWSTEIDVPNGQGTTGKMKIDYKFVGLVKVDDKTVAQLDMKMSMPGEMAIEGTGTVLFDPADGQLLSTTNTNKMTIKLPQLDEPMVMNITMTMKRI